MSQLWGVVKRIFSKNDAPPPDLEATLADLRARTPAPVFWMLGKTQSGKSSIIRYLTGADEAVVGSGVRPCTRTSRQFQVPTPAAPLLSFLDTRRVGEPGPDPRFRTRAAAAEHRRAPAGVRRPVRRVRPDRPDETRGRLPRPELRRRRPQAGAVAVAARGVPADAPAAQGGDRGAQGRPP